MYHPSLYKIDSINSLTHPSPPFFVITAIPGIFFTLLLASAGQAASPTEDSKSMQFIQAKVTSIPLIKFRLELERDITEEDGIWENIYALVANQFVITSQLENIKWLLFS